MHYRKMVLVFGLMVVTSSLFGQDPQLSVTEIADLKKLATYNQTWNIFLNVWAFLGPILGILVTWLAIKGRIQKWADDEITKKANEKIGTDWGIVKLLVDERQNLLAKRAKVKVAIVNHSTGKRNEFSELLKSNGYPEPEFFTFIDTKDKSKKIFGEDFKQGDFQFLVFDNEDEKMVEDDIKKLIDGHKEAFGDHFIWYTKKQITVFNQYKNQVAFVQQWNYLLENFDSKL